MKYFHTGAILDFGMRPAFTGSSSSFPSKSETTSEEELDSLETMVWVGVSASEGKEVKSAEERESLDRIAETIAYIFITLITT
jgi:hypothetical protein